MNKLLWFFRGYLVLELSGASPQWALNNLAKDAVPFWNVRWIDSFSVHIRIPRKYQDVSLQCIHRAMCECSSIAEGGFLQSVRGLLRRPVLMTFAVLAFMILMVLPNYILFYQIVGNEAVNDESVLRALEEIGVGFGKPGVQIKPQWIKNHVLNMIPELEWITVTQNGCRAQVVVRERVHKPETLNRKGLANVIATRDGVITKQSVLAGQPLYKVGDTVVKGDILVSGLVDLERTYAIERANAEIYARTWHKTEVITPVLCHEKQYSNDRNKVLWLEIGEKRIKIYGNSGISAVSCDKMSRRTTVALPGGLEFPVTLITETYYRYETSTRELVESEVSDQLKEYLCLQVQEDMTAGVILSESWEISSSDGCIRLTGVLECHEMIAAVIDVQWDQGGITHDGENR